MTDGKVASEGPYSDGNRCASHVTGPGLGCRQQRTFIDIDLASLLNHAYAEGRASRDGLRTTLKGFLEDHLDYAKINNLPGVENKHWIKAARAALRADEERK